MNFFRSKMPPYNGWCWCRVNSRKSKNVRNYGPGRCRLFSHSQGSARRKNQSFENCRTLPTVTPSFYRNTTKEAALVKHFTEVADYSPKPIVISNLPGNTSVDMSAEGRASAKLFFTFFENTVKAWILFRCLIEIRPNAVFKLTTNNYYGALFQGNRLSDRIQKNLTNFN